MKLIVFILCWSFASALKIEGRIVNGYEATEGEVPYIVGLYLYGNDGYADEWCTGSIIDNEWILTAAHCTANKKSVEIYYGSTDLRQSIVMHKVYNINFVQHEKYNPKSYANDIALIRTPHVDYSDLVQKVDLAFSHTFDNWWSVACGWGTTFTGSTKLPNNLLCADLRIIGNQKCAERMGFPIADNMLCVDTSKGKSICDGDSGGPLVTYVGRLLVGITSFRADNCESDTPVVFTRVGSHLGWIKHHTGMVF